MPTQIKAPQIATGAVTGVKLDTTVRQGWIDCNETWTYAGTLSVNVSAGAASRYSVGDKIKLVQSGTTKYFFVVGIADTVLALESRGLYTVANAAISGNYFSKEATPIGFPDSWKLTPGDLTNNINYVYEGVVTKAVNNGASVNFLRLTVGTYESVLVELLVQSNIIQGVGSGGCFKTFAITNTTATVKTDYQLGAATITVSTSFSAGVCTISLSHSGSSQSALSLRYKVNGTVYSYVNEL